MKKNIVIINVILNIKSNGGIINYRHTLIIVLFIDIILLENYQIIINFFKKKLVTIFILTKLDSIL